MSNWKWCVEGSDGKVIKGWYEDNEKWYYLNDEGIMKTGWIKDKDSSWYYLNEQGALQTGWINLKGIWYYLEENSNGYKGKCYADCTTTINGKKYTFDKDGHMLDNSLVSDACIKFVENYEEFHSEKYDDGTGVITQGYGCIGDEIDDWGDAITEDVAAAKLKELINNKYATVIKADLDSKGVTLTQNEFDALTSMAYNIGTSGLLSSTLYKNVVAGVRDVETITENFTRWSKATVNGDSVTMEGLLKRRKDEAAMFISGSYSRTV